MAEGLRRTSAAIPALWLSPSLLSAGREPPGSCRVATALLFVGKPRRRGSPVAPHLARPCQWRGRRRPPQASPRPPSGAAGSGGAPALHGRCPRAARRRQRRRLSAPAPPLFPCRGEEEGKEGGEIEGGEGQHGPLP
uniref:Predicted protein n=1 Tax=Hordeum vulgare subsp. vulgare TaxID=112509 RepID=F2CWF4_HORVV|nr:predicted protein [Hordeum vulgare subsp. vulgare]